MQYIANSLTCTKRRKTLCFFFAFYLYLFVSFFVLIFQIVSYISESISLIFLLLSVFLLVSVRKKIKNQRLHLQLNLIAALSLLHILSLFHQLALLHKRTCEFVAISLHYFVLATGISNFLIDCICKQILLMNLSSDMLFFIRRLLLFYIQFLKMTFC